MNVESINSRVFDGRRLAATLHGVAAGWTLASVLDEAALCWLNGHRLRKGNRWDEIYPEAESLGLTDAVGVAELVSKHLGVERFGRMLKDEVNVNRLCAAYKRHGLNVEKFIHSYDAGELDERFFGPALRKEPVRDDSGFTARDRREMVAAYQLDRERAPEWAGMMVTDDMVPDREATALWPAAEELEAQGVDIVVLESIRAAIGTPALASLYDKGVDLEALVRRVRRGVPAIVISNAINGGKLAVREFNSARFPTSRFAGRVDGRSDVLVLDGGRFSNIDVSGLLGHPAGFVARSAH